MFVSKKSDPGRPPMPRNSQIDLDCFCPRWLVGRSLRPHARPRSFLRATRSGGPTDGQMGSNVEGRKFQKNCEGFEYCASNLAGRLFRSISAFGGQLFKKMGLCRTEPGAGRFSREFQGLALSRHHSRSDALKALPSCCIWSRHALVPERKDVAVAQRPEGRPSPIDRDAS